MIWLTWIFALALLGLTAFVVWLIFRSGISQEERVRRLAFKAGGFINSRRLNEILGTASLAIITEARERVALDARTREVGALVRAKNNQSARARIENPPEPVKPVTH